ncbi:MAG: protein kinase [Phycisphaeraceae bacterium]|nr:protein kinase [Phycisphaeraceae bacterium]
MAHPGDKHEPTDPTRADPRITQGSTIGHYRLLGRLGEGGFGVVWEAEQTAPVRRRVALKIIKPGMDSSAVVARFEAERQALAVMDHPCIARVYDGGATDAGYPYFVMELVRGEPITDFCDRHRLTIQRRLELFIKVCEAVQHAHMKGVIHRDLKPSNVLAFYQSDTPPTDPHAPSPLEGVGVKVIDFGVAKALNQRLSEHTIFTDRGQMIGTPEYMSPEQAEMSGVDIDTRSDVYSLGVLLYELLTGSLPFDPAQLRAAAFNEIQRIIREVEPPKPSTRLTSGVEAHSADAIAHRRRTEVRPLTGLLRRDLDWVVMRCLEKERDRRYDTPNALAMDLRRYLSDEPVLAGPPSVRYRLGKFARKHRAPLGAAMIVLFVLLVGIAGTTLGFIRADQRAEAEAIAKERAQRAEKDAAAALAEQRRLTDMAEDLAQTTREAMQTIEHNSYIANIQMAGEALDRQQWLGLRQRLDACPLSSRRWEWGWLNACADNSILVLAGHTGSAVHATFGPDGSRIVTAAWDNTARVWDSRTGACITVLKGHRAPIVFASLSGGGTRVATASHDNTARLWDAKSGGLLFDLAGHTGPVVSACFSSDGNELVTASHDGTARIWDCESGEALAVLRGHSSRVHFACFSPQGDRVVTASLDGTARIWDAVSGTSIATLSGHTNPLMTASFSRDGTRLVTASLDRTARVWDAQTGARVAELAGHDGVVLHATFSPDGERVATASDDGTGRVWDTESGTSIAVLSGHSLPVESVAFSPDGTQVVSASRDQTARVWDAATGAPLGVLTGYTDWVKSASYNRDGTLIVSATRGLSPRVWSAETRPPVTTLVGHDRSVWSATFSPDSTRVVTACEDGTARVWNADAGAAIGELSGHSQRVCSAMFDPSGARIVTTSNDGTARVWNALTGQMLTVLFGHSGPVVAGEFSPNGEIIVTASEDSTARLWDVANAKPIRTLSGHSRGLTCARMSPDGKWVVTASKDNSARIWDAATGEMVVELSGHRNWVRYAAFDQSGTRVVTASVDRTARVWDVATGAQIAELRGHTESLNSARFGCDGLRIVTASNDGTARVWDATDGSPLVTLSGHSGGVNSAEFSPDGTRIITASSDGTSRIWESRAFRERYPVIQMMRQAQARMTELVSGRIEKGEGLDEIQAAITASPALLPEERIAALAEIRRWRDLRKHEQQQASETAQDLNNSAWRAVRFAPVAPDVADEAVQDARRALTLAPEHPSYINTLGVALYRAKRFADALETLTRSDALHSSSAVGPQPADRAFIAMALWSLGRHDEARAALATFENLAAEDRWKQDEETRVWLQEARSLISPEAHPPKHPGGAPPD